jgi:hypothetical protein
VKIRLFNGFDRETHIHTRTKVNGPNSSAIFTISQSNHFSEFRLHETGSEWSWG